MKDNNNSSDKNKNLIAFVLIVIIAIIIAIFNWSKGVFVNKKSKGELQTEQDIKNSIQELKNILNSGVQDIKNKTKTTNETISASYGYSNNQELNYGYGTADINYDDLLKNIKPEDVEQYIKDSNDIDNTLKNLEQKE